MNDEQERQHKWLLSCVEHAESIRDKALDDAQIWSKVAREHEDKLNAFREGLGRG